MRLAFGTYLSVPQPTANPLNRKMIGHRFQNDPENVLAACFGDELVGLNVLTVWGSFAFFGPLAVRPDVWDSNIGSRLVKEALEVFARRGVKQLGLFTFPDSPKHLGLYHKFGFCSRFLTPLMDKKPSSSKEKVDFQTFSELNPSERRIALDELRSLSGELFPGLDLSEEITMTDKMRLGDTLIITEKSSRPAGFAICQSGPGTEAGGETVFGSILKTTACY